MKKLLLTPILFFIFFQIVNAQFWKLRRFEVAAGLGTTQIYGDIGGFSRGENLLGLKDFTFRHTRFNMNMNVRYRITDDFSARLNMTYGGYHSTDIRGSNEARGFEAKTHFLEYAVIGEFYFLKNKAEDSFLAQKGQMPFKNIFSLMDCYSFTGLGLITYNVDPNSALAAMSMQTKGRSPVIPVGIGVNFSFSPDFNIGAELGGRYTFTDFLDGYTSQYSERKDIYYFFNLSCIYKIRTATKNNPSF